MSAVVFLFDRKCDNTTHCFSQKRQLCIKNLPKSINQCLLFYCSFVATKLRDRSISQNNIDFEGFWTFVTNRINGPVK